MFKDLTTDDTIKGESDVLGGFKVYDSGVYTAKIELAYAQKSPKGAMGLHLVFKMPDSSEMRNTLYVTSGDLKGNKNYYENSQGEKNYLPGFNQANALCLLTVEKSLSELDTEEKVINLYSPETKSEIPTKVQMLTDLLGKEITLGLLKQTTNKNVKDADGKYQPTAEIREENEIDKMFRAIDGLTKVEIDAKETDPKFLQKWKKKWEGKVKDKTTKTAGTAGAPSGSRTTTDASTKPTSSLFND